MFGLLANSAIFRGPSIVVALQTGLSGFSRSPLSVGYDQLNALIFNQSKEHDLLQSISGSMNSLRALMKS